VVIHQPLAEKTTFWNHLKFLGSKIACYSRSHDQDSYETGLKLISKIVFFEKFFSRFLFLENEKI